MRWFRFLFLVALFWSFTSCSDIRPTEKTKPESGSTMDSSAQGQRTSEPATEIVEIPEEPHSSVEKTPEERASSDFTPENPPTEKKLSFDDVIKLIRENRSCTKFIDCTYYTYGQPCSCDEVAISYSVTIDKIVREYVKDLKFIKKLERIREFRVPCDAMYHGFGCVKGVCSIKTDNTKCRR